MRDPAAAVEHPEAVYPVRAPVPWVQEEGRVVVLLPKRLGPLARAMRQLTRGPTHLRVPLDEVGSQAFLLADGTRTARDLAAALEEAFGDRAGPQDRALAFLATLARNDLLLLATAPEAAPAPAPAAAPAGIRTAACPRCGHGFHVAEAPGTRLQCPACRAKFTA